MPWKVKFKCQSCFPVCSLCPVCPVCPVYHLCPVWPICGISLQVVAKCLPKWPIWKVSMVIFVRKSEVVWSRITSNLLWSWRLSDQMRAEWQHGEWVSPICRCRAARAAKMINPRQLYKENRADDLISRYCRTSTKRTKLSVRTDRNETKLDMKLYYII